MQRTALTQRESLPPGPRPAHAPANGHRSRQRVRPAHQPLRAPGGRAVRGEVETINPAARESYAAFVSHCQADASLEARKDGQRPIGVARSKQRLSALQLGVYCTAASADAGCSWCSGWCCLGSPQHEV